MVKTKLPCLVTALSELGEPRYMTPRGIFDAWQRKIPVWGRSDLTIDDGNIGLNGSPTRVKKSFTKAVKGKGTVVTLDPEESAGWLVDRLSEKFVI